MDRLEELRQRFAQEPLANWLGARLESLADGQAAVGAPVRDDFLIVGGLVQGGVITILADYAGVYAAMSRLPTGHTPASQISISFLRPFKRDETIQASAEVVGETRGQLLVLIEVRGGGKLKAQATIVFAKPRS